MTRLSLIPLLPLVGFLINGLLGSRFPRWLVSLIACVLPAASFALTVCLFTGLLASGTPVSETYFSWAALSVLKVDVALYFDQISAVMCMVVTGVGTLIHIYSIGYMCHDESYSRYFAYLNLFLFFMLTLVLGKNMLILFAGWEGVGLASYLLIGYWFKDSEKTAAGMKAFVVNRVGDTGFILAAFLIWYFAKTLDFQMVNAYFSASPPSLLIMNTIGILMLIGACGKSAQIPLHVWLPDAMAGPTPVSALIHAATMVTAGVYLLSRANGVFLHAPLAMNVVAWGGCLTAFLGASMGLTQYNLKKVLAYSTMSQIGYMFMACGLGAYQSAMFHLYTHAFFKACLFLGAGAVLHALHGEEDMRNMGGLAKKIPFTFATFLLASLALCGVPPFAGFFSKDEILTYAGAQSLPVLIILIVAAFFTAFYMGRQLLMVFGGKARTHSAELAKENPPIITVPLIILAVLSALGGLINFPGLNWLETWLEHTLELGKPEAFSMLTAGISLAVALSGLFIAWLIYGRRSLGSPERPDPLTPLGWFYRALEHKWWVDEIYQYLFIKPYRFLAREVMATWSDQEVIDGVANDLGHITSTLSRGWSVLQNGMVRSYALMMLLGVVAMLAYLLFR